MKSFELKLCILAGQGGDLVQERPATKFDLSELSVKSQNCGSLPMGHAASQLLTPVAGQLQGSKDLGISAQCWVRPGSD